MMARLAVLAWSVCWLPLLGCALNSFRQRVDGDGPRLLLEPPNVVRFSNEAGASLPCSAEGQPAPSITWETADGSEVHPLLGLTQISSNGSLVFRPFGPSHFRPEVHSATYRCVASNQRGLVKSRPARVQGVVAENFSAIVHDVYAIRGNAAVLRCQLPTAVKDYVTVTSWVRNDGIVVASLDNTGRQETGGRYVMLPSGELVVREATAAEAFHSYRCQARNEITGQSHTSQAGGKIVVTEAVSDLAPRITETRRMIRVVQGTQAALPCVAQGHPSPTHTWFRLTNSGRNDAAQDSGRSDSSVPIMTSNTMSLSLGGSVLVIRAAGVQDGGRYICVASNSVGKDRAYTELSVSAPLSARIDPPLLEVDAGRAANLTCRVAGQPVHGVLWMHNGQPLFSASSAVVGRKGNNALPTAASAKAKLLSRDVLLVASAKREDSGMYQCMAYNGHDAAQGTAEIIVREDAPVLKHAFSESLVAPGSSVSLRCAASGNPLPQVTWTLDGDTVPETYHVRVGDYVSNERLVHSYVNFTSVRVEDGGLYTCEARNSAGQATNSARLVVPGKPLLRRPMSNVTALAGHTMVLHCPVAGHPIRSIGWQKDGRWLPQNHRQRSFPNGTLLVTQVQRGQDSGWYGCAASDPMGNTAGGQLAVRVMTPPVVSPFKFPDGLTEGKRAGAACIVSDGDQPISIGWLKDGHALDEQALDATVSRTNDYTSFLSFVAVRQELHSGTYTCVASNPAASANRSADMLVRVGPRWRHQPEDKAAILGHPVLFDCQADGFPAPTVRWKKERLSEDGSRQFATITSSARVRVLENGSLAIDEVDRSDSGRYLCQSQNGIGPGISSVVNLDVQVAAHFEERFRAVTARRGEPVRLECRAQGDPSIKLTWTRDGRSFDATLERRYAILENDGSGWSESVLRITGTDRRDSSLFVCHAENAYGNDDASFRLIIQEPPDKVEGLEVMQITSRSLTVSWLVPYSGNSPVLKYLVEHKALLSSSLQNDNQVATTEPTEHSCAVTALQPSTTYELRIRAVNAIGLGDFSDPIIATTSQEAPSGSPRDIQVSPISSRTLQVTWKPPLEEETHGGVQGYYVGYRVSGSGQPYLYKTLESRTSSAPQEQQCFLGELRPRTRYGVVVQAFNAEGAGPSSDEIVAETLDVDPPTAPRLNVVSCTSSSIQLKWDALKEQPVEGYMLFYKAESRLKPLSSSSWEVSEWSSVQTGSERSTYLFRGLGCGRAYTFYALAFNSAGRGPQSNVVLAKTDGSVPVAPELRDLVMANATCATLKLSAWKSGGCPITSFTVLHRRHSPHDDWAPAATVLVTDLPLSRPPELAIQHLTPATRYHLLVSAHTEAGSTDAEYVFTTLTLSEDTVSAPHWTPSTEPQRRSIDVIVPAACTVFVAVVAAAALGYALSRRRLSALRRRRLVWRPGDETARSGSVSKSAGAVPMCIWEKSAPQQHLPPSRPEQLYLSSPFDPRGLASHSSGDASCANSEAGTFSHSLDTVHEVTEPDEEQSKKPTTYDVPFAPRDSMQKLADRDDLLASAERLTLAKSACLSQAPLSLCVQDSTEVEAGK